VNKEAYKKFLHREEARLTGYRKCKTITNCGAEKKDAGYGTRKRRVPTSRNYRYRGRKERKGIPRDVKIRASRKEPGPK